jgi:hypothetical protein
VNIPVVFSEGSDRFVELVYIEREYFQDVVSGLNYFSLFIPPSLDACTCNSRG